MKWTKAYKDKLPDSAFLIVSPGGHKVDGRTHPLSLRHLPVRDLQGNVSIKHVRNALSRISRTGISAAQKKLAREKAEKLLSGRGSEEARREKQRRTSARNRARLNREGERMFAGVMSANARRLAELDREEAKLARAKPKKSSSSKKSKPKVKRRAQGPSRHDLGFTGRRFKSYGDAKLAPAKKRGPDSWRLTKELVKLEAALKKCRGRKTKRTR